ncbi:hypothetical protein HAX54_029221 [Datura stramonium]|uniref:Uncharacterized protein n=1 Tax=Datura stramonium TaxID=4076 RepID=A0ABS8V8D7_DATST|nr:hypothetical protein [Datura stramonium]
MEQARYWMSTKRKHDMTLSNNPSSYGDSWRSKLAEDAAEHLEKRIQAAQALGGHMNVHRRDRARMKQSPPSKNPSASSNFKKEERNLEVMIDSNIMAKQDHVETNCKRRRVDHEEAHISFANIFPKTSSIERCRPQSEALERIPSAIEELDLELKL